MPEAVDEGRLAGPGWYPPTTPARERKHRLVAELKALVESAALLDPEAADPGELERLAEAVAQARSLTDDLPNLRRYGGAASSPDGSGSLFERSPISGRGNPLAPPLVLAFDGAVLRGHAVFGDAYEGPPGSVHGGWVAAAFDELLGVAQQASGLAGYTGTLTIRMRALTPLRQRIDYEAGVDRVEGRKIHMWGCSYADGTPLCEAEGVFIAPSGG